MQKQRDPLGIYEYFLILLTLASIAGMFYFAGVAYAAQQRLSHAALIEHEGDGETVMITRDGEVVSEWEPRDGEVYDVLDEALHEE
jgi:hypothetical protein